MPDMFPGMNPYLEHPDLWPEIHPQLVTSLANLLQQEVSDRYSVLIRKRVYRVSGEDSLVVGHLPHDVPKNNGSFCQTQQPIPTYIAVPQTVKEGYIEIVDCQIGRTVTIIEILTPQRKRPGRGRDNYEQRCEAIFGSDTHFVEIDLLRGWEPISAYVPSNVDYRVLVSRSDQRPKADLYAWQVNAPIPPLRLPLNCDQDDAERSPKHVAISTRSGPLLVDVRHSFVPLRFLVGELRFRDWWMEPLICFMPKARCGSQFHAISVL